MSVALFVYGIVAAMWATMGTLSWSDLDYDCPEEDERIVARFILSAPIWPLYLLRVLGRGLGTLVVAATRPVDKRLP